MKINKIVLLIIIGFILAIFFHFIALAAIDAPHNESNNVSCGSCHGQGLLNSPFWGGSGSYDSICIDICHSPQQSCPFTDKYAPLVKTHVDSDENALAECRTCHDPHYQKQKNYKNTDANELYLAWGTIECPAPVNTSCPYDSESNTTTLQFTEINYKSESGWDVAKLTGKTDTCRRTILFPNVKKLGYSYPIIAIDEGAQTITAKGDARPVYQYISSSTFAAMYGQYVKDTIGNSQVKLADRKWTKSFADGDLIYNGVCEICHTQTLYHRNDGSGAPHYPTVRCTICHTHVDGFLESDHTVRSGEDCEDCHGHDNGWEGGSYYGTMQSHSTHTEYDSDDLKGPYIDCGTCHDIYNYPYFKSGTDVNSDGKFDLSETDVCDTCHSPDGVFDGVDDAVIGAKNNWTNGVYASPTLKPGKEKWCAGCHDDQPAYSKSDSNVIIVDNLDPGATYSGTWDTTDWAPGYYGTDYHYHDQGGGADIFTWTPVITTPDQYPVYARWTQDPSRAPDATYTIYHDGGITPVVVDQRSNGGKWVVLGTFSFDGTGDKVELVQSANGIVIADAVSWGNPGIYAPNIIGNNTTYGFFVTGHKINCLDCHDAVKNHIDHEHRTYASASDNYQAGYRLKSINSNQPMKLPRPWGNPIVNWTDFRLCFSCHDRNEVLGDDFFDVDHTNFWHNNEDYGGIWNSHDLHLQFASLHFDSDWDGITDSAESCIACHNVHGSTTPVMIRHGELISTYGTTDKVPALDFIYLGSTTLAGSTGGRMNLVARQFVDQNGVCDACHMGISYYRTPFIHISALNPKAMPHIVPNGGDESSRTSTVTVSIIYHGTDALNVTIDLSPIGGSIQSMTDEGNGLFSYNVIIPTGIAEGSYVFNIAAVAGDTPDTGETSATIEVIPYGSIYMNDTDAIFAGSWNYATGGSKYYEGDVHWTDAGDGSDTATYTPDIIIAGDYNVYAWWPDYTNRADHVPYMINYNGGSHVVYVNQQEPGNQWILLGTYPFAIGSAGNVVISDDDDAGFVMADAIKWEPVP